MTIRNRNPSKSPSDDPKQTFPLTNCKPAIHTHPPPHLAAGTSETAASENNWFLPIVPRVTASLARPLSRPRRAENKKKKKKKETNKRSIGKQPARGIKRRRYDFICRAAADNVNFSRSPPDRAWVYTYLAAFPFPSTLSRQSDELDDRNVADVLQHESPARPSEPACSGRLSRSTLWPTTKCSYRPRARPEWRAARRAGWQTERQV